METKAPELKDSDTFQYALNFFMNDNSLEMQRVGQEQRGAWSIAQHVTDEVAYKMHGDVLNSRGDAFC
jgi:hypothetical protein